MGSIKKYYRLTKPGIVYGNCLAAVAGFLLASKGSVDLTLLLATLAGIALVMASACVFNNYIDRDLDKNMARTKKRALVTGTISTTAAITYATALGVIGFLLLAIYTNILTVAIAAVGFVFYVVLYALGKRRSVHGTLVGSVSGAVPPVVGYCAVTNAFDGGAFLLFLVMVCWQMPHFYAIAMYRLKDYAAASLPVLPVKKGMRAAKVEILLYITAYILLTPLLTLFGYTGLAFAVVMGLMGLAWLRFGVLGFMADDDAKWARKMFGFSLLVLLVFCLMLSVDSFLP